MEQNLSTLSGLGFIFTLSLSALILCLPRKLAVIPLFLLCCYMTLGQVLAVGGINLTIYKILIVLGMLRIVIKGELQSIQLNRIDKIFIAWFCCSVTVYLTLRGIGTIADSNMATSISILLTYFIFRSVITTRQDVSHVLILLSMIIIPLSMFFLYEVATGVNLFSVFGGVKEISEIRNGHIRCQGPFRHPILAGTFGATSLPLLIGVWKCHAAKRVVSGLAIIASIIIVITSASSGPLLASIAGGIGLALWHVKDHLKVIRWGVVALLLVLHATMKAPVWFLFARLSDVFGGGGYHRSALIDAAIQHFDEWWLLGTTYTAHWMPYGVTGDPDNADLTNQFIVESVKGGAISLLLYIWLISAVFKNVGNAMSEAPIKEKYLIWSLGCCIFSHIVSMFSITYFDHTMIMWCLILASIATISPKKAKKWKDVSIAMPAVAITRKQPVYVFTQSVRGIKNPYNGETDV